ncbi:MULTISPECIES: hypothetical protein [unclassified Microbacterium]|mgnify:CR=1 FL=1|uniref:hypothetical protein n=1 Tax=unclassified Microbacterium TaxID=2609290 RepID=UPI001AD1486D|nr:hypothetical protein [Microbacterium sp.]MBN9159220.1 hypothetical protein [Microbacterium sp.]
MTTQEPEEIRGLIARIAPGWSPTIDVGTGWYPLLAQLDRRLAAIAPRYIIHQVKSKFGALSFYAQPSDDPYHYDDAFRDAITAAEWESTRTCEECAAPARTYTIGMWVWTLCEVHASAKRGSDPN